MSFLMVSCVRWFTCVHHLDILFLRVWFVTFDALFMAKEALRARFRRFASMVTDAGFSFSAHDPTLFIHMSPRGRTLLLFYVDNMIATRDDPEYIAFIKTHLSDQFLMSGRGPLRYFLGIEFSRLRGSFCLKRSIFSIFSIELHLLIIGLLRLPWSSMFTLEQLMVSLLRILLVIVTL
jgi:hypothetical protein